MKESRAASIAIDPSFWSHRQILLDLPRVAFENPSAVFEFTTLDLDQVVQKADALHDREIEQLIFGPPAKLRMTAFTMARLKNCLTSSGLELLEEKSDPDGNQITVLARPAKNARSKARAARWDAFRDDLISRKKRAQKTVIQGLQRLKSKAMEGKKLDLGGGEYRVDGYISVDMAPAADIIDNIITLEKVLKGHWDQIFSSHALEHVSYADLPTAISNQKRLLKNGGEYHIRVPNGRAALRCLKGHPHKDETGLWAQKGEFPRFNGWADPPDLKPKSLEAVIGHIYGYNTPSKPDYQWSLFQQHKSFWSRDLAVGRFERAGFKIIKASDESDFHVGIIALN